MQETQTAAFVLKPKDYNKAINKDTRFHIQFKFFSPDVEGTFLRMLHRYLEKHDVIYMKEMILTVARELITNAVKANTKRLYFKLKDLDINEKDDYREGMESFKKDVYVEESDIFEKLLNESFAVRVSFETSQDKLRISIVNNSQILKEELTKIQSRIKKAYTYIDISEAFVDVLDDSEGAGLGLIMALMLFKNAGLPSEAFRLKSNKGLTTAMITIPLHSDRYRFNVKIAEELVKEIEKIPSFPENIIQIQKLCSSPESTMRQISESITRDPGLTTSILKIANSAGYITLHKTKTLEDAVKLIGLKAINTLLIASGVQKIMESRYKKFQSVWQNSYRAAFYAHRMSMQAKRTKLSEFVYLTALLADIGQIILLSVKPDVTEKIHEIAGTKIIENASLLEEMSLGVSHGTLGSLICKKWRFNEALIKVVEYHERPHMAPEKYKGLIYMVHLAYVLVDIEDRKLRFELVDEDVLDYYGINNQKNFEMLHNTLKKAYEMQQADS